jgi:hypothetical protein
MILEGTHFLKRGPTKFFSIGAWLDIGTYFQSIVEEHEKVWRNVLFEPPPLLIFHQEERTKESEETRDVEEERFE